MAKTVVDTSVLVAGVLGWHSDHAVCLAERERWEHSRNKPCIPVHALLESYSVITRLPAGHRLRAEDARAVLRGAYSDWPVAPFPADCWQFLEDQAASRVVGGAVYDAAIIESAMAAGAVELVTLDQTDFERLGAGRILVRLPGGA